MSAPSPAPAPEARRRVQWWSPWVVVPVAIVVLYATGLLDDGFLYLERLHYAPWSIGDGALTGAWAGTVPDGTGRRKLLLNIALRLGSYGRRSRRGNWSVFHDLRIDNGDIQLHGSLTVCAGGGRGEAAVRYALMGWANGDASDVRLWPADPVPAARFSVESLEVAWQSRSLPASLTYTLRNDAADAHAAAPKHTVPVTFTKPWPSSGTPHC